MIHGLSQVSWLGRWEVFWQFFLACVLVVCLFVGSVHFSETFLAYHGWTDYGTGLVQLFWEIGCGNGCFFLWLCGGFVLVVYGFSAGVGTHLCGFDLQILLFCSNFGPLHVPCTHVAMEPSQWSLHEHGLSRIPRFHVGGAAGSSVLGHLFFSFVGGGGFSFRVLFLPTSF